MPSSAEITSIVTLQNAVKFYHVVFLVTALNINVKLQLLLNVLVTLRYCRLQLNKASKRAFFEALFLLKLIIMLSFCDVWQEERYLS